MRVLWLVLSLMMVSCSKPDLAVILNERIELFSKYEDAFFKNISITPLSRESNQESPTEFEIRRKGKPSFAVIQTLPESKVLKNYYTDSLTMDFVNAFSELNLTWLWNYDVGQDDFMDCIANTHLEFEFGKQSVILFRGSPHQSKDVAQVIIDKSSPIDGKWRFFVIPAPPN